MIPKAHCPPADVFLHAGDITNTGEVEQLESFSKWLSAYPAEHKVVIAGNHDITLDAPYYKDRGALRFHGGERYDCVEAKQRLTGCTYLEDSSANVLGYEIYGSPYQPSFCDWAFNLPRGELCDKKWQAIPHQVDVLITHGPAFGLRDVTSNGEHVGCVDLRKAIEERQVSVSLAGHVHEGYAGLQIRVLNF